MAASILHFKVPLSQKREELRSKSSGYKQEVVTMIRVSRLIHCQECVVTALP